MVLKVPFIVKAPNRMAYEDEDAVLFPLGDIITSSCLFAEQTLRLEVPSIHGNKEKYISCLILCTDSSI